MKRCPVPALHPCLSPDNLYHYWIIPWETNIILCLSFTLHRLEVFGDIVRHVEVGGVEMMEADETAAKKTHIHITKQV